MPLYRSVKRAFDSVIQTPTLRSLPKPAFHGLKIAPGPADRLRATPSGPCPLCHQPVASGAGRAVRTPKSWRNLFAACAVDSESAAARCARAGCAGWVFALRRDHPAPGFCTTQALVPMTSANQCESTDLAPGLDGARTATTGRATCQLRRGGACHEIPRPGRPLTRAVVPATADRLVTRTKQEWLAGVWRIVAQNAYDRIMGRKPDSQSP